MKISHTSDSGLVINLDSEIIYWKVGSDKYDGTEPVNRINWYQREIGTRIQCLAMPVVALLGSITVFSGNFSNIIYCKGKLKKTALITNEIAKNIMVLPVFMGLGLISPRKLLKVFEEESSFIIQELFSGEEKTYDGNGNLYYTTPDANIDYTSLSDIYLKFMLEINDHDTKHKFFYKHIAPRIKVISDEIAIITEAIRSFITASVQIMSGNDLYSNKHQVIDCTVKLLLSPLKVPLKIINDMLFPKMITDETL